MRLRARLVDALQFARQEHAPRGAQRRGARDRAPARRPARAAGRARGPPRRAAARRPPRRAPAAQRGAARAGAIEDRELEALGHHWRIYDLLEAGRVEDARTAHRKLNTLAAALHQPLYNHFAVGWEVVWAQMAGRVEDAQRLAREAFEYGVRAQARDAETIFTAQNLILARREEGLSDHVATIAGYVERNPALSAWAAILPMAHLMAGDVPAGVAQFRALAQDEFAAIPRDMFWFTAIALLGETSALLRDASQRAASSTACSRRTRTSSCRSARPRASAPPIASSR